jgi:FkbM family methyltransferase
MKLTVALPRIRSRIEAALCSQSVGRLVGLLFRDRVPSGDCVIDLSGPGIAAESKAAILFGLYERSETRFVERWLPRDLDVVELGASIGVVSCHIARLLGGRRRLICVEANGRLIQQAERNIAINGWSHRVVFVHGAIDYSNGDLSAARFSVAAHNNLGSRLTPRDATGESIDVPVVTLSQILLNHGIGDFALVCDIEGAEAGLIENDARALSRCRFIVIELHEANDGGVRADLNDMIGALESLGFVMRARSGLRSRGPVCVFERLGEVADPLRADAR